MIDSDRGTKGEEIGRPEPTQHARLMRASHNKDVIKELEVIMKNGHLGHRPQTPSQWAEMTKPSTSISMNWILSQVKGEES